VFPPEIRQKFAICVFPINQSRRTPLRSGAALVLQARSTSQFEGTGVEQKLLGESGLASVRV
jgi:hypothetical protein